MRNKPEIVPAILPADFAEVAEKIDLVQGLVKTVQIDVCDGQFTPQATWPYAKRDDSFEKILKEEEGFPGWEKLNFEIDLMANNPEALVDEWVMAGALRIIIHVEARGDIAAAIEKLKDRVQIGLALNLDTSLEAIEPYRDSIQVIQLMGIKHIGFQGEAFQERVIDKVRAVRAAYPQLLVSVDGGVSLESAEALITAGADRLIVGSAIFGSDNFVDAIANFKEVAHKVVG
jgi:ribulose-phosphate 3-epimerase